MTSPHGRHSGAVPRALGVVNASQRLSIDAWMFRKSQRHLRNPEKTARVHAKICETECGNSAR